MGNNIMQRTTIKYDGERLTLSPITCSAAAKVLGGFEACEMLATFGTETLAVMPAESDELIGVLGISLNHESALRFLKSDPLLSLLFPAGKGRWKLICIDED